MELELFNQKNKDMYTFKVIFNLKFILTLFTFGILLTSCDTKNFSQENEAIDLTDPIELRSESYLNIERDFCFPGECCKYTICSKFNYSGDGDHTLTAPSFDVSIIRHPLVLGQPICWSVYTCNTTELTLMVDDRVLCTEFVKCGGCPVTFTYDEEVTDNLHEDQPEYADCCIFNFSISSINVTNGCSLVVETGPLGGVRQNGLIGQVRLCPDEEVNLVLECDDGTGCHVCTPDISCP